MLSDFTITGFRCFEKLEIPRLRRLNLVTGKNGTGKTTLLEAFRVYACRGSPHDLMIMLDVRGESEERDAVAALATILGDSTAPLEAVKKTCTIGPGAAPLNIKLRWYQQDRKTKRWVASDDRTGSEVFLVLAIGGREERIRADWATLRNPISVLAPLYPSFFVGLEGVSPEDLDSVWQQTVLDGDDAEVITALTVLEPKIARLAFGRDGRSGQTRVRVAFQGSRKQRPLSALGAGVHRLLGLLLACHGARGGFLLVDEIDTGLHYSVQARMWELLATWTKQFDVQILATTHSLDCVRAFAEVARREEFAKDAEGAALAQVIRLGRRGNSAVQAFFFDEPDAFEMVGEGELEVR